MRVLLSDGSGLTARQTAAQLADAGHHVDLLSPDPPCLARFTRRVHRVWRVPAYGVDHRGPAVHRAGPGPGQDLRKRNARGHRAPAAARGRPGHTGGGHRLGPVPRLHEAAGRDRVHRGAAAHRGQQLRAFAAEAEAAGAFGDGGVLAQRPAAGPLVMAQAVFAAGELVAAHTWRVSSWRQPSGVSA